MTTPTRKVLEIIRDSINSEREEASKAARRVASWKGDHAAEFSYWNGKSVGLNRTVQIVLEMMDAVEIEEEKELDEQAAAYAEEHERSEKDCLWEGEE